MSKLGMLFERPDPQQAFGLGVRQRGKVVIGGTREIRSPKRNGIGDDGKYLHNLYKRLIANLYN